MRLLLRKIVKQVDEALTRLDDKTRNLDRRVSNLESKPAVQSAAEPVQIDLEGEVSRYFERNPIRVPQDGQDATSERILEAVEAYLLANPIRAPQDGLTPSDEDILKLVEQVFESYEFEIPEVEVDYERIVVEVLARVVMPDAPKVDYDYILSQIPTPENGGQGEKGDRGEDGVSITGASIEGYNLFLTFSDGNVLNVGRVVGENGEDGKEIVRVETKTKTVQGEPGQDGVDGVGIEDIRQDGQELVIELTNGDEKRFKLPATQQYVGGSGVSETRVIQLIEQFGGGGGGGEGRQEVFIDEQPVINYPAISYTLIAGTNLYRQAVNVP